MMPVFLIVFSYWKQRVIIFLSWEKTDISALSSDLTLSA